MASGRAVAHWLHFFDQKESPGLSRRGFAGWSEDQQVDLRVFFGERPRHGLLSRFQDRIQLGAWQVEWAEICSQPRTRISIRAQPLLS